MTAAELANVFLMLSALRNAWLHPFDETKILAAISYAELAAAIGTVKNALNSIEETVEVTP